MDQPSFPHSVVQYATQLISATHQESYCGLGEIAFVRRANSSHETNLR